MRLNFFQIEADWAVLELKRWNYRALELLLAEGVEVWVVSIPSPAGLTLKTTRLSPVVRYAAREPRGLLTSPNTRWNGVIREVDLAPTIYRALTGELLARSEGAAVFEARQSDWHRFWNGWLARIALRETTESVGIRVRTDALQRSLEWVRAHRELVPFLTNALFTLYFLWAGIGIVLWQLHCLKGVMKRVFVAGMAVFCLLPAVAVLYAYYPFELWSGNTTQDLASIAGWLTLCWLILSLVSAGIARRVQIPLLCAAALIAMGVCCLDLLIAGGYGVNRSLLSAGIGGEGRMFGANEWFWAFALAAGVLTPACWLESRGRTRLGGRGQTALGMAYGVLLCLFGLPLLGAALDSWLPMTLAFGLGIGLFTGALSPLTRVRQTAIAVGVLVALGVALTALAVVVDSLQPWQRQAGWGRDWSAALSWRLAPLPAILTIAVAGAVAYALRGALRNLWRRAYALDHALFACLITATVALLLGKVVAAGVILATSLMFALEYLIGGKEWGYAYEGNGVAH
ncbi:MAG: hypothetical protein NZ843_06835 [Fimbriimonadales bacterium]|nr:hypothetical protein [Fimbriimonadales bacterium]